MGESLVQTPQALEIRRAAMDMLARREHGYQELLQKLQRKFNDESLVREQLDALAGENLQSDHRYCETYVRSKCGQGQGPRRIYQALKQRGIAASLIEEQLWHTGIDWQEQLALLYQRRYGEGEVADSKERARRMRFLQYRGFDFDQIKAVIN